MPRRLFLVLAVALALPLAGCMGLGSGKQPQNAKGDETPEECKDFQVREGDFMWAYNGKAKESNAATQPWYTASREVVVETCPFIDWGKVTVTLRDATGNHVFNQTFNRASEEQSFQVQGNPGGWLVDLRWEGYTGHMSVHIYPKV
ncbi:MAG TPA: hypothetical protein VNZ52_00375 [Candidatus Thermoplasmatota archaeon]|nr:hypothetical protein [Candidatus Thermoplasmatota archaeon]